MAVSPLRLIEFPADDPERARRFWNGLLGVMLEPRTSAEGEGWQTRSSGPAVGVHARGPGPGDSLSLPYFEVDDLATALEHVEDLGGTVIHPGDSWAVSKDTEGSPFGLAARTLAKGLPEDGHQRRTAADEEPLSQETVEIGYREDGLIWVTAGSSTPSSLAAERCAGPGWRVIEGTWLRPTGESVNSKDDEWEECLREQAGARPGWRLVNTRAETILYPDGDEGPNLY